MDHKLPREVFLAIAAVGWIDGTLESAEADAIARAAVDEGLELSEVESIERAVRSKIEMRDVDVEKLTPNERLYVYAMATWIAMIDGDLDAMERAALDALGFELRITHRGRIAMDEVVKEQLARPEGNRPERFDLAGLRRAIEARIKLAEIRRNSEHPK